MSSTKTNETPIKIWFYGIEGIDLIWHGCWNAPELEWYGHKMNYYDIETPLRECYQEDCQRTGKEPEEDKFGKWVKNHANLAKEICQNMLDTSEITDEEIKLLWSKFEDVPMNPETERMEAEFLSFPAGTHREEIWEWFDQRYSGGVYHLLYGDE